MAGLLLVVLSERDAQTQYPPQTSPGSSSGGSGVLFRAEVSRVVLYATVFDSEQRLVTGLPKEAFRVYQDGKLQTLSGFSNQDIPVSMGIAVDSSASMTDKRAAVNAAALALVRASHPADEVFLVDFKDTVSLTQDFTNDISKLEGSLSGVSMWGGTAVMDATHMAVDHLRKGGQQKRVLIVITDGEDDSSDITQEALLGIVQKSDVTIYAIGLLSQEPTDRRKNATKLLQAVAKVSGGASYFPQSVDEVEALATQIAHDIRNQYVLEFPVPPNTKLGYRNLRVTSDSKTRGKLAVRTRPGYYYQPTAGSSAPASTPSKR
jgi:VWFA-related protein